MDNRHVSTAGIFRRYALIEIFVIVLTVFTILSVSFFREHRFSSADISNEGFYGAINLAGVEAIILTTLLGLLFCARCSVMQLVPWQSRKQLALTAVGFAVISLVWSSILMFLIFLLGVYLFPFFRVTIDLNPGFGFIITFGIPIVFTIYNLIFGPIIGFSIGHFLNKAKEKGHERECMENIDRFIILTSPIAIVASIAIIVTAFNLADKFF